MDIELRLAKTSEARTIARMSRDFIEAGLGWTWTPDKIARQVRAADTLVVVAHERGQLIGFACMRFREEDAHLNLLCVQRSHQRLGMGRRLLEWLEKTAMVAGIVTIHLEVRAFNQQARRFYHALGYQESGELRRYYRGRESAIRMVRHLRAMRWSEAYKAT
jgi:ribosomal-protein-alanine N-acetyltransferase